LREELSEQRVRAEVEAGALRAEVKDLTRDKSQASGHGSWPQFMVVCSTTQ
jgi:hypothetical protein